MTKAFPMLIHMDGKLQGDLGMDLRDYFAAKALQGMLVNEWKSGSEYIVGEAYRIADEMMKARAK